jgi:hypothetical protein
MKLVTILIVFLFGFQFHHSNAQTKKNIAVDVGHGQKFYSDPADATSSNLVPAQRLTYMTGELSKNAAAANAVLTYQKSALVPEALAKCDLLFIHVPSSKYTDEEVAAINEYVNSGGSLFVVMEVDYWATHDQTNVNDLLKSFGIAFKSDNPDTQTSGGHSTPGKIVKSKLAIPYHGARLVEGGTPFAFSDKTDENPFGVYKEVAGGGKIVAMGDGMVSLYMTSWEGVNDYQCAPFMADVVKWLLE